MEMWLCDVVNVKNELLRVETGWSSFEERETKLRFNVIQGGGHSANTYVINMT